VQLLVAALSGRLACNCRSPVVLRAVTVIDAPWMMDRLSAKAHLSRKARPHCLRHGGITRALEVSGGDVRGVQRLSRRAKLETLMRYDDNRRDDPGALAQRLADADDATSSPS
jgi:integrase